MKIWIAMQLLGLIGAVVQTGHDTCLSPLSSDLASSIGPGFRIPFERYPDHPLPGVWDFVTPKRLPIPPFNPLPPGIDPRIVR